MQVMKRAMTILPWVFRPPAVQRDALITKMVEWSNTARKQGLLGLEAIDRTRRRTTSCAKACSWWSTAASRTSSATCWKSICTRANKRTRAPRKCSKAWASTAPTLGIIGAVLGLMAVMQNLADPAKLGHGIAAAFVATIYGIGLANLFFLPVASKLKVAIQGLSQAREMVIEGMISIAQGENPRSIEAKLQGYLH